MRLADVAPDGASGHYSDGIKFGPDGRLWIGQFSHGQILVVDAEAKLVRTVEVPSAAAPNLAFGADGSVYVMAVDNVNEAPWPGKVHRLWLDQVPGAAPDGADRGPATNGTTGRKAPKRPRRTSRCRTRDCN